MSESERFLKIVRDGGPDFDGLAGDRVFEGELLGVKEEAGEPESLSKCDILFRVTVPRVADDGAIDVSEVASQLVAAAGFGIEGNERIAGCGVLASWNGQFGAGETLKSSEGVLGLVALPFWAEIQQSPEWTINLAGIGRVSPDDGEVLFGDAVFLELLLDADEGRSVESEEQYTGCGLVDSVTRENGFANLVAETLHGEMGFFRGNIGPVHEQSGWLEDRDVVLVLVQDLKGGVGQIGHRSPKGTRRL